MFHYHRKFPFFSFFQLNIIPSPTNDNCYSYFNHHIVVLPLYTRECWVLLLQVNYQRIIFISWRPGFWFCKEGLLRFALCPTIKILVSSLILGNVNLAFKWNARFKEKFIFDGIQTSFLFFFLFSSTGDSSKKITVQLLISSKLLGFCRLHG